MSGSCQGKALHRRRRGRKTLRKTCLGSKAALHSTLRDIPGVGPRTEERLLLHFGSLARVLAAPFEELSSLVGPSLAKTITENGSGCKSE